MKTRSLLLAACCLLLLAAVPALAQESTTEFWPEVDSWLRVSPQWRFSLFVPISKNIETHYREGNLIAQVDFAFGETHRWRRLLDESRARRMDTFLLRGGYLGGKSLGDDGAEYDEHMAFVELHVRIPLKGSFLLSHRFRPEARWLGQNEAPAQRYRYRLMLEREFMRGRVSLVPYVNGEAYYDSRYDTVNRIRAIGGATVGWSRHFAIEGNWTYQHDSRSSVTYTNAFGLVLHLFLETKGAH
jgi:hypothetical protein